MFTYYLTSVLSFYLMNENIETYCSILGIDRKSSISQIKRAYRHKCKELHPDLNKKDKAHEDFILLHEAYHFMLKFKTKSFEIDQDPEIEKWFQENKERARHRASQFADMKFEDFKNTLYFKQLQAGFILLETLKFILALIIIALPFFGFISYGRNGFWIGLLSLVVFTPFWAVTIPKGLPYPPKRFIESIKIWIQAKKQKSS